MAFFSDLMIPDKWLLFYGHRGTEKRMEAWKNRMIHDDWHRLSTQ
jgi:hypothetical protein